MRVDLLLKRQAYGQIFLLKQYFIVTDGQGHVYQATERLLRILRDRTDDANSGKDDTTFNLTITDFAGEKKMCIKNLEVSETAAL